jgi:hypothetical protein
VSDLEASVLRAAAELVAAFGSHNTRRYFDGFAPEATFLFHAEPALIPNRAAYEAIWTGWERDGFRVLSCRSLAPSWLGVHEHLSPDSTDETVQTGA